MPETPTLQSVRELKGSEGSGRAFASVVLLRKQSTKTASNGNAYLTVEFGDRTGSFGCTVFSDNPGFDTLKSSAEGSAFRIEGKTDTYQGRFSPKLTRVSALSAEEMSRPETVANLVESAPEDGELLWKEFLGFADSLGRAELRATVRAVIDDIGEFFRVAPAAVQMHHAYRHGLLEHTVHMARAAKALLPVYPEVDPDMAMAGILLHDTGKAIEYEGSLAVRRSRRGILQGHVVLGYQLVRKAALKSRLDPERTERLEHIILSHQGQLDWGAAVMAASPEAVFVSMVDNLDARMGMVQRALRNAPAGEDFSERLPGLESALLVRKLPD